MSAGLFPELGEVGAARARPVVRYREPLPQPEGRSAQYWALELVAARDAGRKAVCYSMMILALRALDHTRGH